MRKALIILSLFIRFISSYAQVEWRQIWNDEFEYTGLPDSSKWTYDVGGSGWGNEELQFYTNKRIENAKVENGILTITAKKEVYQGNDYTSARILSKGTGDWKYGKIEVRAKIPSGKGIWPAIWMLPSTYAYGSWPNSGEIDIMEYVGYDPNTLYFTVHTEAFNHKIGTQVGTNTKKINAPYQDFHTYILEWEKDSLSIKVDEIKYFTFRKQPNASSAEWPFDQPFHLLLNVAVGGTWGGAQGVDDTIFPQKMEIDYVRVFQKVESNQSLSICAPKGGTFTVSPEKTNYTLDDNISLLATPNNQFVFEKWSGNTYNTKENPFQFTLFNELEICPIFTKKGELLKNSSFQNGNENWSFYGASAKSTDTSLCFKISQTSTNPWDIQLSQNKVTLIKNENYTFSFKAWSNTNRSIKASLGMDKDPWSVYYNATPKLTTEPKLFSYNLNSTISDPEARVIFDIGQFSGDVCFSEISLLQSSLTPIIQNQNTAIELINPVEDWIALPFSCDRITIIDGNGRTIITYTNTEKINVSKLLEGIYFLNIENKGEYFQSKFIKK